MLVELLRPLLADSALHGCLVIRRQCQSPMHAPLLWKACAMSDADLGISEWPVTV